MVVTLKVPSAFLAARPTPRTDGRLDPQVSDGRCIAHGPAGLFQSAGL